MLIQMIEGATRVLGKAQGYIGLPVRDEVVHDKASDRDVPSMTTAWRPSPAEMKALNDGACIYVRIFGTGHPPIMLFTGDAEPMEE